MEGKTVFSATSRAGELVPKEVEIGGVTFKVRRTGTALKNIIELAPEEELENDDPSGNIEILYQGLSYVLVDPEKAENNGHPDPQWLMDELDFEVAQELMEKFVPRRAEGNLGAPESTSTPGTPVQA